MYQPPLITPFVLIADIDNVVIDVTAVVVKISRIASPGFKFVRFEGVLGWV